MRFYQFLSRDAMHGADYAVEDVRPSVCRPSQGSILSTRPIIKRFSPTGSHIILHCVPKKHVTTFLMISCSKAVRLERFLAHLLLRVQAIDTRQH